MNCKAVVGAALTGLVAQEVVLALVAVVTEPHHLFQDRL
jgi:hypothetical protein